VALVSDDVRVFFDDFERSSRAMDLDAIGQQFADVFMSADPSGVVPVPKAAFLAALPKREKMFSSAGVTGIRLTTVREMALDSTYTLVTTDWIADVSAGAEIPLKSTFILRRDGSSLKVVFYLNHQDIGQLLADR
jgi:hypothetical protein